MTQSNTEKRSGRILFVGTVTHLPAKVAVENLPAWWKRNLRVVRCTPTKLNSDHENVLTADVGPLVKAIVVGFGVEENLLKSSVERLTQWFKASPQTHPTLDTNIFVGPPDLEPKFREWVSGGEGFWTFCHAQASNARPWVWPAESDFPETVAPLETALSERLARPHPQFGPDSDIWKKDVLSAEVKRLRREFELIDAAVAVLDFLKDPSDVSQLSTSRNTLLQEIKAQIDHHVKAPGGDAVEIVSRCLVAICLASGLKQFIGRTSLGRIVPLPHAIEFQGLGDPPLARVNHSVGLLSAALVLIFYEIACGSLGSSGALCRMKAEGELLRVSFPTIELGEIREFNQHPIDKLGQVLTQRRIRGFAGNHNVLKSLPPYFKQVTKTPSSAESNKPSSAASLPPYTFIQFLKDHWFSQRESGGDSSISLTLNIV